MRFRYDKAKEYLKLLKTQIKEGTKLKQKIMLREAMRSSEQN